MLPKTPVDPPASCQPYVAEYPLLTNYYYASDTYGSAEYATGRSGDHLGLPTGSQYGVPSPNRGQVLLQTPYPAAAPEACGQQADTTIAVYPLITPSLLPTSMLNIDSSRAELVSPQDSSFTPPSQVDSPRAHYGIPTMRFRECDIDEVDCGGQDAYVPVYSKMAPQPCDDGGNPQGSYSFLPYSLDLSIPSNRPLYASGTYHGEYAESPIEESAYGDQISEQACDYSQHLGNDQYQLHPQPNLPDTISHASYSLSKEQSVRFCPSSTHPYYFYPRFNSPPEATGYGSHTVPSSARHYGEYPIPTPRLRQVHDIHNLHSSCPGDAMSSTILPQDRGLSVPRILTPQPIPHPSPFMESIPNRKVVHIACYFCRKRKIACQRPLAGSRDSTCKQCFKRKLKCKYPTTSHRGVRPQV